MFINIQDGRLKLKVNVESFQDKNWQQKNQQQLDGPPKQINHAVPSICTHLGNQSLFFVTILQLLHWGACHRSFHHCNHCFKLVYITNTTLSTETRLTFITVIGDPYRKQNSTAMIKGSQKHKPLSNSKLW